MNDNEYEELVHKVTAYKRRWYRLRKLGPSKQLTMTETLLQKALDRLADINREAPEIALTHKARKKMGRPPIPPGVKEARKNSSPKYYAIFRVGSVWTLVGPYQDDPFAYEGCPGVLDAMKRSARIGKVTASTKIPRHWSIDVDDPEIVDWVKKKTIAPPGYFKSGAKRELSWDEVQTRMKNNGKTK